MENSTFNPHALWSRTKQVSGLVAIRGGTLMMCAFMLAFADLYEKSISEDNSTYANLAKTGGKLSCDAAALLLFYATFQEVFDYTFARARDAGTLIQYAIEDAANTACK